MPTYKELSDANPDGTRLGQSATDKISFYGATPVARGSSITAITAGATTTACNNAVISVMAALSNCGLIVTA
jgi:hypothetical protein